MPTYKLTYFPLRGRAETIRLILAASGSKFEDNRVDFANWGELKPKTPWGTLPLLEVNGKTLGQSNTICRFLAKETGLAGKNAWEQAQVDAIADSILDIRESLFRAQIQKDEEKKALLMADYMEKQMPPLRANLEKTLIANGGGNGWLVGKNMTWADLHLVGCTEHILAAVPSFLDDSPKLAALVKRVKEVPKVAKWLETRPVTDK